MNKDEKKQTCIIIPFFNEEKTIGAVLSNLISNGYSVVTVNDGSFDNSKEIVSKFSVYSLEHSINLGQGAALQTGIEFARKNLQFNYFVTFDADGQHQVQDIDEIIKPLVKDESDFVFGSRFMNSFSNTPIIKKQILKFAIFLFNFSRNIKLSDTHNGFRAFNRKAAEIINLNFANMTHASEFIDIAINSGLRITEVPVSILYTDYSKKKGQSIWNSVNILVDLFLR